MTYYIVAVTNDRAELIKFTAQTTDREAADMIAELWVAKGFKIKSWEE